MALCIPSAVARERVDGAPLDLGMQNHHRADAAKGITRRSDLSVRRLGVASWKALECIEVSVQKLELSEFGTASDFPTVGGRSATADFATFEMIHQPRPDRRSIAGGHPYVGKLKVFP